MPAITPAVVVKIVEVPTFVTSKDTCGDGKIVVLIPLFELQVNPSPLIVIS
jgi:hypothetical protein